MRREPSARLRSTDLRNLGIEPARATRWFRSRYGVTFQEYQRNRTLGRALVRVRRGESVTRAALESGFESESGFRDAFTRLFGAPPTRAARDGDVVRIHWISTPIGSLLVGAHAGGICFCEFLDRRALPRQIETLRRRAGRPVLPGRNAHLERLESELANYFSGRSLGFTAPIDAPGTPFQEAVWRELRAIPAGETRSYADLARALGRPGRSAPSRAPMVTIGSRSSSPAIGSSAATARSPATAAGSGANSGFWSTSESRRARGNLGAAFGAVLWHKGSVIAFASDRYTVPLPPGHPFPMGKYEAIRTGLIAEGTLEATRVLDPGLADRDSLLCAHDAAWVDAVLACRVGAEMEKRIGISVDGALVARSRASAAGTLAAARRAARRGGVESGRRHAPRGRARGAGFCVVNDLAIAALRLLGSGEARRVAIVDLDVHQGDGTNEICVEIARSSRSPCMANATFRA
mgnify:CR=1 FL=1